MKYYGVNQSCHGHEYRWIFSEDVLQKQMYQNASVPDDDCIDCGFPIGGSNSSATFIKYLPTEKDIKDFLTETALGPDSEDPMLCDIGEYLLTVDTDYDSCTDIFLKKFGLTQPNLEQIDDAHAHRANTLSMFHDLMVAGIHKLDFKNPFYGRQSDMRYSELCALHDQIVPTPVS